MEWQKDAFELFIPSDKENEILHSLDDTYTEVCLMNNEEREFLNGIILRNQPKKLLEVGVHEGGSSVIMLNAIKNNKESRLISIDYLKKCLPDKKTKNIGHIVDFYPYLSDRWTLFTGGLSLKFMEEIGVDIDLCFIDTVHSNPGEILDTLMVLPFLKDDAFIIFHDVNSHTASGKIVECNAYGGMTNNLLFSAINGKKYIQGNFKDRSPIPDTEKCFYFPNIGAIKIDYETKKHVFEIFNLLTLKWVYLPSEEDEQDIINFFTKYYDGYFINYLKKVFFYHRECFRFASDIDYMSMQYLLRQAFKKILGKKIVGRIRRMRYNSK